MTEQPDKRPLGQVNFDAYNAERGGKTHDGKPTPPWEVLGDGVRSGWTAGALAVLNTATFPDYRLGGEEACPGRYATPDEQAAWDAEVRQYWWSRITRQGALAEDLVLRELATLNHLANEVPVVYSAVTGDRLSNLNYFASGVLSVYQERRAEEISEAVLEALCVAGDLADGDPEVLEFLRAAAEVMEAGDFTAEFAEYRTRQAQLREVAAQAQLGVEGRAP